MHLSGRNPIAGWSSAPWLHRCGTPGHCCWLPDPACRHHRYPGHPAARCTPAAAGSMFRLDRGSVHGHRCRSEQPPQRGASADESGDGTHLRALRSAIRRRAPLAVSRCRPATASSSAARPASARWRHRRPYASARLARAARFVSGRSGCCGGELAERGVCPRTVDGRRSAVHEHGDADRLGCFLLRCACTGSAFGM